MPEKTYNSEKTNNHVHKDSWRNNDIQTVLNGALGFPINAPGTYRQGKGEANWTRLWALLSWAPTPLKVAVPWSVSQTGLIYNVMQK